MKYNYTARITDDRKLKTRLRESFFGNQLKLEYVDEKIRNAEEQARQEAAEAGKKYFLRTIKFSKWINFNLAYWSCDTLDAKLATAEDLLNNGYNLKVAEIKIDDSLLEICNGVTLITGLSNVGKSTLIREFEAQLSCKVITYGEPIVTSLNSAEALGEYIGDFLMDEKQNILIVDSITEFLFASGNEAATTGGLSTNLLIDLNKISNLAARQGKSLILVLNLLSQKDNSVVDALQGRVHGLINIPTRGRLEVCSRITPDHRFLKQLTWNIHSEETLNISSIVKNVRVLDLIADRDSTFDNKRQTLSLDKKGRWDVI